MKRATIILAASLLLPLGGCLKKSLRAPVEDHRVQTQLVAESCERDGYGAGKCTKADLEAMRDQACLIDAIVKGQGRDAASCGVEEGAADGE